MPSSAQSPHVLQPPADAWRAGPLDPAAGWSRDLQTTLGYMHLAKGETERAIRLLDEPFISPGVHANGNLTATEPYADQNTAG